MQLLDQARATDPVTWRRRPDEFCGQQGWRYSRHTSRILAHTVCLENSWPLRPDLAQHPEVSQPSPLFSSIGTPAWSMPPDGMRPLASIRCRIWQPAYRCAARATQPDIPMALPTTAGRADRRPTAAHRSPPTWRASRPWPAPAPRSSALAQRCVPWGRRRPAWPARFSWPVG